MIFFFRPTKRPFRDYLLFFLGFLSKSKFFFVCCFCFKVFVGCYVLLKGFLSCLFVFFVGFVKGFLNCCVFHVKVFVL